jgi:hypothetical protein
MAVELAIDSTELCTVSARRGAGLPGWSEVKTCFKGFRKQTNVRNDFGQRFAFARRVGRSVWLWRYSGGAINNRNIVVRQRIKVDQAIHTWYLAIIDIEANDGNVRVVNEINRGIIRHADASDHLVDVRKGRRIGPCCNLPRMGQHQPRINLHSPHFLCKYKCISVTKNILEKA